MTLQVKATVRRTSGFELNVNLKIDDNCVTALYGRSGSGKTTLLRLITGLENIPGASVVFNSEIWQSQQEFVPVHQRRIGYVFQHLNLFPHMTADQNLRFAEQRAKAADSVNRSDIIKMLDIEKLLPKRPDNLSGGEQQRVAIARALLSNPQLLVMDEPLGSIDSIAKARILPYLQKLHDHLKIPVIYVSHALDEVLEFADHVVRIDSGQVTAKQTVIDFSIEGPDADLPHGAAIIRCSVEENDAASSLTRVNFEGQDMYIAGQQYKPGDQLRLRVPARDVSLAREKPAASSIVNVFESKILDIHDPGEGPTAVVIVGIGSQQLLARVTRKSVRELGLGTGDKIFTQVKGVALMTAYDR